jgi:RecA/RadA recombinase
MLPHTLPHSLRLDVRSKDKLSEAGRPEPIGSRTRVKVVKNKVWQRCGRQDAAAAAAAAALL